MKMTQRKQKALRKKGWKIGTAEQFLKPKSLPELEIQLKDWLEHPETWPAGTTKNSKSVKVLQDSLKHVQQLMKRYQARTAS